MSLYEQHWTDAEGQPDGGMAAARGLTIAWQRGPLTQGEDGSWERNGASVGQVLGAVIGRLTYYQTTQGACEEYDRALTNLYQALSWVTKRALEAEGGTA